MVATSLESAVEDMLRLGGDLAEFVRWKKFIQIIISGSGDGAWSEIDERMDSPTVPADAASKAKFVEANGKLFCVLYRLTEKPPGSCTHSGPNGVSTKETNSGHGTR